MQDERLMERCLKLAAQGKGKTSPNPLVGAVVVQNGEIVGAGFHHKAGTPHAEVWALQQAGSKARDGTLYVSLEPCCHYGRTPPCTDQIIAAGIRKVVVAIADPNPKVAGKGIAQLREAGLEVVLGVCAGDAKRQNEVFLKYILTGKPFVIWKTASSLDGKIATSNGHSQWVTSSASRRLVHQLRAECDGIMVGSGTILADDPELTARPLPEGYDQPQRIVLDSRARICAQARVFADNNTKVLHFIGSDQNPIHHGTHVTTINSCSEDLDVNWVLDKLGKQKITSVLLEGGTTLATSFWRNRAIDKVWWFVAPKVIGQDGISAIGNLGNERVDFGTELNQIRMEQLGQDILVEAYPPWAVLATKED